ncbi:hypothetical protein [Pedobacter sp.]|uniref:hypothetical protein n=1 Tax=Pedobacter sp. TaxID=1411316 RepID=UPI0031E21A09
MSIVFMLLSISGCAQKISFPSLSEKIYKKNGGRNDKSTFKLNAHKRDARDRVYLKDSASFLRNTIDTLYIMEGYNIENGTLHGTIWNKNNSISYSYFRGKLEIQNQSVFSDYQILLVTKWDVPTIRKEEEINGIWFDSLQITASKCYREGKDWRIDEISFNDFYNPKRGY